MESAESELSLNAGDYLLVWGPPDPNASVMDAETLDGRRGLVPSNFCQRLVGDDLLEFHQVFIARSFSCTFLWFWVEEARSNLRFETVSQAVVTSLRDVDESATTAISDLSLSRDVARLAEMADLSEGPEDDDNGKNHFDFYSKNLDNIRHYHTYILT